MGKKTLWLKTHFLVQMIFRVLQNTPRVLGFQWKCLNRLHVFLHLSACGGALSHNAVLAQPPFSCCILKIVKCCRSESKFRRRVQMQLIAQNRKYFDVLLQILVIDSKLKGTYTLLMGLFPSCTDFWKIVYYWLFSRLYPCARTRVCARTRNL